MKIAVPAALIVFLLAGCSTAPMPIETRRNDVHIQESDVVDIALSEADRSRLDYMQTWAGKVRRPVESGTIWRKVFAGGSASPVYSVKSSELHWVATAAGFAARMDYTAEGEFTLDGTSYAIKSSGSQSFAIDGAAAMYDAIATAVIDAARQCRDIIKRRATSAP